MDEIKITNSSLDYPLPGELFHSYRESTLEQGLRSKIAQFYEIFTAAIFDGEWNRNKNLLEEKSGHLHPDVVCYDKLIDSKCVCLNRPLKIRDIQFNQYFLHQGISTDNRKIFYAVCRYAVDKPIGYLRKKENALEEMVSLLSEKTDFLVLFPFSVAVNMHNPNCSPFSRYETDKKTGKAVPDPLTQIPASGLSKLFNSLEEFLIDCGTNPEHYNISRTVLPSGIKMNKFPVTSFPIIIIEDKDYECWLAGFRKVNSERIKELKEKIRTKHKLIINRVGGELNFDG